MSPTVMTALPGIGATRPAAPAASEGASTGFAAALDDAADASTLPTEMPTDAITTGVEAATPVVEAAAVAITMATVNAVPGWPPPGLSSLFPAPSLLGTVATEAAASAETALASTTALRSTPVLASASVTAAEAAALAHGSSRGRLSLAPGAETLPPDPLGPRRADAPLATVAPTATSIAMLPSAPTPGPAPMPNDAIALALARQPAALRLPIGEGENADLGAIATLTEAFAPERPPDGASPLSTATSALPKLDLAQAFPAPVPLPSSRFADDVGARLQWIAEQQGGEATLRIAPEGLGPVEVRMKLDGDRVELGFSAAQNDTRQALQDALPKLREMLAQQGLQLGHADVGQKHAQTANDEARHTANGVIDDDNGDAAVLAPAVREASLVIGRSGRGLLDLYA